MREASTVKEKYATLGRQLALFGSGTWAGVYDIGPHKQLIGDVVSSLHVAEGTESVSIDGSSLFADVVPNSLFSPGHISGSVKGADGNLDLAVAVNGTIRAVTQTFDTHGSTHFASFVPDDDFRAGVNTVDVYAVRANGSLERLRGGTGQAASYTLSGSTIHGPNGRDDSGLSRRARRPRRGLVSRVCDGALRRLGRRRRESPSGR